MSTIHGTSEFGPATARRQHYSPLEAYWNAFREWRKRERLRAALDDLSDRDLKDIGIGGARLTTSLDRRSQPTRVSHHSCSIFGRTGRSRLMTNAFVLKSAAGPGPMAAPVWCGALVGMLPWICRRKSLKSAFGPSRYLLRLHIAGHHRSEADIVAIYEYAP
jgi:uncharacterized protein YjiS (DUF1127 family)